jgi:hypothetical protein
MTQPARARLEQGGDTRERLLFTAQHLYAREGIHAGTLRPDQLVDYLIGGLQAPRMTTL